MTLINVIFPIFLVIFLGYLLKRIQFVSDSLVMLTTPISMLTIPLWVWFVGI